MKKYFVKSLFYGWREVSKEQADNLALHIRRNASAIPAEKREEYIKTRIKVEEAPCENC